MALSAAVKQQALKAVESVQRLDIRAESVEHAPVFHMVKPEPSSTIAQMPESAKRDAVSVVETVKEQITMDARFNGTETPSQSIADPDKGQRTAETITQMQQSGYGQHETQRELTKDSPSPSSGYE
jgi:hypothetical protein